MRRNIFILPLLFILFFVLIGILPAFAVTVSQDVLTADDTGGGGIVGPLSPTPKTPTPTPPVIIVGPVVPPITPPDIIVGPVVPPATPPITPIIPPTTPISPITPILPTTPPPTPPNTIEQPIFPGIIPFVEKVLEKTTEVVQSPFARAVTRIAQPIGIASAVVLIATQAILATAMMTVTSFSDIYLLGWRLLGLLFGAGKRRGKPWGTVYDSITKRPLDPAYVVVLKETGEEVSDAITDLDGRYGFLVPTGKYKLRASKTNYAFPTKNLESKTTDEIYENIYHGEPIDIKEGEVVVRNIPLDPIGFDWNEFEKNKQNLFRIYSERERSWKKIFDVLYFVGLVSAIIATVFDPRTINIVFLCLYFAFIIYNLRYKGERKAISVKYSKSMEPIPFAIIKIFFADLNNQVKTVVADHMGRFYFLVGPGKYYFTVDKKLSDGTYSNVHKSVSMDLPHGVLNQDILV